jgi:hypothetical protein
MAKSDSSWAEYMEGVPPSQRGAVADVLMTMPVDTYADLNAAIRFLLAETIRGTIHPDIMQIAIRVMEFSAVSVAARSAVDGSMNGGMNALMLSMKQAKQDLPKLEARFSNDHPTAGVIDVIPARRVSNQ